MILLAETAEDTTKFSREAWETETHKNLAQAVTDLHVLLSQLVQTHAAHKWVVPLTAAWIKIPTAEMLQLAELLEKDLGAETKTTAHRYSQDWVQEVFPKASLLAQMQVQYCTMAALAARISEEWDLASSSFHEEFCRASEGNSTLPENTRETKPRIKKRKGAIRSKRVQSKQTKTARAPGEVKNVRKGKPRAPTSPRYQGEEVQTQEEEMRPAPAAKSNEQGIMSLRKGKPCSKHENSFPEEKADEPKQNPLVESGLDKQKDVPARMLRSPKVF
jgi:hypothetical protein